MRLNPYLFLFVVFSFSFALNCSVPIEQQRKSIQPKTFVIEDWNNEDLKWTNRPGIARDLVNRNILIGKNRKEISDLLGEPYWDDKNQSQVTYELEQLFQRGVDLAAIENLKITFNSTDTVEKAEIEFTKTDWR